MRKLANMIDAFAPANGPPPSNLLAFTRWALRGSWLGIRLSLIASMSLGVLEAAGAVLVGWVIDTALNSTPDAFMSDYLWSIALIVLVYVILRPGLMVMTASMSSIVLAPGLFPLILTRLNRHTLGQSLHFFDNDFAGRLAQKQMQTTNSLTEIVIESINAFSFAIVTVVTTGLLLSGVSLWLGAILFTWVVVYLFVIRALLPRVRAAAKKRAAARAAVTGQVVDTFTNMATVKLFANSELEDRATHESVADLRKASILYGQRATQFRGILVFMAGFLPVGLIGGALWLWQSGAASPGDIAMAGLLSTRIAQMTGWVSFTAMAVFSHIGEVEDGIRTLSPPHGVVDSPDAVSPSHMSGKITFDRVGFHYGREDGAGLTDFSLTVDKGEKIGLVGRSGAGKSTATALLLRLYDLEQGSIRLDGIDVSTMTQDALRRQISMVRQETSMFNRSAYDNIAYGRPEASEDEVYEAARRAEADEFIKELRDLHGRRGYDAHLGERGVKLSGGQRQRVALARAILKDAPVLVLDEATSALDSEVEAAIQDTLYTVMQGKTVIAIAHRLSTIARMDRIIVMEDGRIAESGTHTELLAQGGLYAGFWSRQSGGFIGIEAAE